MKKFILLGGLLIGNFLLTSECDLIPQIMAIPSLKREFFYTLLTDCCINNKPQKFKEFFETYKVTFDINVIRFNEMKPLEFAWSRDYTELAEVLEKYTKENN